jgi:Tol biopolymer transport system component
MNKPRTQITIGIISALALAGIFMYPSPRAEAAKGPINGRIVFSTNRDGNSEIYLMNADGSGQINLTNNATAQDERPTWSANNDRIVFQSQRGPFVSIFVMNADGTNVTQLTADAVSANFAPVFSPVDNRVAFESTRDANNEIYVMNGDGTGQTRLTNNPAVDSNPQWSPDGKKIVFQSFRDGNSEIYLMNADGSGQTRLTNNAILDQHPSFSPDGTRILFQSIPNTGIGFFLMSLDGTNVTQVPGASGFQPIFSPDGEKILFSKRPVPTTEIFMINSDGSNEIRLTNNSADDDFPHFQSVFPTDTVGVFRASTGQFLLRNSNSAGGADLTVNFGQAGDQPLSGDWDGNGKDDVGVFRPSTHQFLLRQQTVNCCPITLSTTVITVNFGQSGDLAVVGDWNGDGIDSPGVFRPTTGQWFLTNLLSAIPRPLINFFFGGAPGDQPVAGDWNHDGKDSIGLFRATTNEFLLRNANSSGNPDISLIFGAPGDLPLIGDWNADGVDTVGLLRNGTMFLSNTFVPTVDLTFTFGASGDRPVAGDWNGVNNPPNSGVNSPSNGSLPANQTQTFTTTCSDPDGWRNIATIDFKIAKSDGNGNGVPVVFWVQFDQGRNMIRFYDPDLDIWTEGQAGSNITLSSGYADLNLAGTQVLGSGPTGPSVQVTRSVLFKKPAVQNNYKQYLKITDDFGLTTGFEKVGSWNVTK